MEGEASHAKAVDIIGRASLARRGRWSPHLDFVSCRDEALRELRRQDLDTADLRRERAGKQRDAHVVAIPPGRRSTRNGACSPGSARCAAREIQDSETGRGHM